MIINYGKTTQEYFNPVSVYCSRCGTPSGRLIHKTTWVSLFFIPIIPLSDNYYAICNKCHTKVEVSREEFEELRYRHRYVLDKSPSGDPTACETLYPGRNAVQINYLKHIEEARRK